MPEIFHMYFMLTRSDMSERNHSALTQPLVTVFMAVYNTGEYVKLAVDSILHQTYPHFELIIVNDGSTDSSDAIISAYTDERIIYLKNEKNIGIVKSRNLGIDRMGGKYLAVLDSDDVACPDRLQKQVAFMEANPEYGLCGTYFHVINCQGETIDRIKFPLEDKDIRAYLHLGNCFCHSSIVIRAELIKKYGYSEANLLGEDYKLFLDIVSECKLANLPFLGCYYRVHKKNVSYQMNGEMFTSIKEINRYNLTKLNFPFTEKQLEVHSHFLIFNADYFNELENFDELENWVKTLISVTQSDPDLNRPVVFKFLLHRWFVICYKKRMIQKVLFTDLLYTYKMKYISVMLSEAYDHSTNKYLKKLGRAAILSIK
jgi:glycosyltransferase involved in cell wall biosynthesis